MRLAGAKALVVGAGASGRAAARFLLNRGADVTLNDKKSESDVGSSLDGLRSVGVDMRLGSHPPELFRAVDLVVVSPGVPRIEPLTNAHRRGVPVWSEVELASRFVRGSVLAVTGTNGKSTVTSLLGAMCKAARRDVFVGGNLGSPLVEAVDTPAAESSGVVVVELSSFQLEWIVSFRAHVAALLNISPDHLDRYDSYADYLAAKSRIFEAQQSNDAAVIPHGDEVLGAVADRGAAKVYTFGADPSDVALRGDHLESEKLGLRFPIVDLPLQGRHNALNACAAVLMASLAGVDSGSVERALTTFTGLAHRMQWVRTLGGVKWYDDSKATNVGAAAASLDGLGSGSRVVLIAGGRDKGGSYEPLRDRVAHVARAVVLLGESAPLLARALKDTVPLHQARSMESAVATARRLAQQGDAVLLAPACSSFDMFSSYVERGLEFQRAVHALEVS